MIGHKAIGRNGPIEPMTYFPKQAEEPYPIFIIKINGLTPVTTRSNVVQQACQFESKRSCHKNSIAQNSWNARPDPLTPPSSSGTLCADLRRYCGVAVY